MCCCFLTRGWIRFGRAGGEGSSRSSRVRYNGCVTDFAAFLVRMRPSIFEHPPQGQPMAAVVASPVDAAAVATVGIPQVVVARILRQRA